MAGDCARGGGWMRRTSGVEGGLSGGGGVGKGVGVLGHSGCGERG